ncbi:hypothetical protein, conserved [Leishmania tarentolae]|uniref:Uncharacterized protein n=1 Tax=Leishmania tarentolae TaxID=5689 RepID=A0A640KHJ1_LEITA|nr:hypothetical protein, conserved [Leishmania tarentolae]
MRRGSPRSHACLGRTDYLLCPPPLLASSVSIYRRTRTTCAAVLCAAPLPPPPTHPPTPTSLRARVMSAAPRAPTQALASKGAAGLPPSSTQEPMPGGTPGLPFSPLGPNGPDITQLMRYLPTILKVAAQIPGILVGFLVTMMYMLLVVCRKGFTETVSPVAGFHIFIMFLLRELIEPGKQGQTRARAARAREAQRRSFATDIAMQYREKLD